MHPTVTIPDHIAILLEKHLAGAASEDEVRELGAFAKEHAGLGAELEAIERSREAMTETTRTFVEQFDWSRAERAFETRLLVLDKQRRFLAATLTLWTVYVIWRAGFEGAAELGILLIPSAAILGGVLLAHRIRRRRILAYTAAPALEREAAYEDHLRSSRRYWNGLRAAMALVFAIFVPMGVALGGVAGWSMVGALAVLGVIFWFTLFSRDARRRLDEVDRGL
jgi:hypothetical protein